MKVALALALVAIAAVGASANVTQALKKCQETSKLKTDQLTKACEGKPPTDETELRNYKCFAQCVQQGVGIMSASGEIDPDRSRSLVPQEQQEEMKKIAEKCLGDGLEDLCDKAYAVDKCYAKENRTMYVTNCKELIKTISN